MRGFLTSLRIHLANRFRGHRPFVREPTKLRPLSPRIAFRPAPGLPIPRFKAALNASIGLHWDPKSAYLKFK